MLRILEFSDFSGEKKSSSSEDVYSLEQISEAIESIGKEDLSECFFVSEITEDAIVISVDLEDSSGTIDASLSDDSEDGNFEYFEISWDKSQFTKFLKWALRETKLEDSSGPKFTLNEVVQTASDLVESGDCKAYIESIDTRDVWVSLGETNKGGSVTIYGRVENAESAKIDQIDLDQFRDDLIEKLVKSISGASDFSY